MFVQKFHAGDESMGPELGFLTMYTVGVIIVKAFVIYEGKVTCEDPIINFTSVEVFKCKSSPNCCS